MATINVLIGQCGTQLGTTVLQSIAAEAQSSDSATYQRAVSTRYFREPDETRRNATSPVARGQNGAQLPQARSVLVDMESKVVEQSISQIRKGGMFDVSTDQCVTREEGSANNWAFGYHSQGVSRLEAIVDNLRREAEASSTVSDFHVVHSLAGGTGSGVGCLVSDAVRSEFPHATLTHSVVWPFSHGEMTTQWFNCLMALQHLHNNADSVHVLGNDDVAKLLRRASSGQAVHQSNPSFEQINEVMSGFVSSLMLPAMLLRSPSPEELVVTEKRSKLLQKPREAGKGPSSRQQHLGERCAIRPACAADIVETLSLDPQRKVFTCETVPIYKPGGAGGRGLQQTLSSSSWQSVIPEALRVTQRAGGASLLVMRGPEALTGGYDELVSALSTAQRYTPVDAIFSSMIPFRRTPAHISVYTNSGSFANKVRHCLGKVETLLEANAYTHHYERYGVEQADFEDAMLHAWQLAHAYGGPSALDDLHIDE